MNISNSLNPKPINESQSTEGELLTTGNRELNIESLEQEGDAITQSIASSGDIEQTKRAITALNFFAGVVLGVMTAMTTIGVAVTPVGWGIVGAALAIGMTASFVYGGGAEGLKKAILNAMSGYSLGFGTTSIHSNIAKIVIIGGGNAISAFSQLLFGTAHLFLGVKIQAQLYEEEECIKRLPSSLDTSIDEV